MVRKADDRGPRTTADGAYDGNVYDLPRAILVVYAQGVRPKALFAEPLSHNHGILKSRRNGWKYFPQLETGLFHTSPHTTEGKVVAAVKRIHDNFAGHYFDELDLLEVLRGKGTTGDMMKVIASTKPVFDHAIISVCGSTCLTPKAWSPFGCPSPISASPIASTAFCTSP